MITEKIHDDIVKQIVFEVSEIPLESYKLYMQ